MKSLFALFVPGVAFYLCLFLLQQDTRFSWLHDISAYPWQFWVISICGTAATLGGVADWMYHRLGLRKVGAKERQYEFWALAGGIPLFGLMAIASLAEQPTMLLIPVILVVLCMTVLICYDEFTYHRRCQPIETAMHRLLVLGHTCAWLAWAHWCFVAGGSYA